MVCHLIEVHGHFLLFVRFNVFLSVCAYDRLWINIAK